MIKLSPSYVFEKSRYHGNFVNFVNFSIYTRDYEWSLFPWTVTYSVHGELYNMSPESLL